jgi:hypothetical protein
VDELLPALNTHNPRPDEGEFLSKKDAHEILEMMHSHDASIYPCCINIVCAFLDQVIPIRMPRKAISSRMPHHKDFMAFEECSKRCSMFLFLFQLMNLTPGSLALGKSSASKRLALLVSRAWKKLNATFSSYEKVIGSYIHFWITEMSALAYTRKKQLGTPGVIKNTGRNANMQ